MATRPVASTVRHYSFLLFFLDKQAYRDRTLTGRCTYMGSGALYTRWIHLHLSHEVQVWIVTWRGLVTNGCHLI